MDDYKKPSMKDESDHFIVHDGANGKVLNY